MLAAAVLPSNTRKQQGYHKLKTNICIVKELVSVKEIVFEAIPFFQPVYGRMGWKKENMEIKRPVVYSTRDHLSWYPHSFLLLFYFKKTDTKKQEAAYEDFLWPALQAKSFSEGLSSIM